MANDMFKLKIDLNLVMFSFQCKSIFNGRAIVAIFVMTDIQYG